MSERPELCVRGHRRGFLVSAVFFIFFGLGFSVLAGAPGGLGVSVMISGGGMLAIGLLLIVGSFVNLRYKVVYSKFGIHVAHPYETFSVEWSNIRAVTPLYSGLFEVAVNDESRVHIRTTPVLRVLKSFTGQPNLTVSTIALAGGAEEFLEKYTLAHAKWAAPEK